MKPRDRRRVQRATDALAHVTPLRAVSLLPHTYNLIYSALQANLVHSWNPSYLWHTEKLGGQEDVHVDAPKKAPHGVQFYIYTLLQTGKDPSASVYIGRQLRTKSRLEESE